MSTTIAAIYASLTKDWSTGFTIVSYVVACLALVLAVFSVSDLEKLSSLACYDLEERV